MNRDLYRFSGEACGFGNGTVHCYRCLSAHTGIRAVSTAVPKIEIIDAVRSGINCHNLSAVIPPLEGLTVPPIFPFIVR